VPARWLPGLGVRQTHVCVDVSQLGVTVPLQWLKFVHCTHDPESQYFLLAGHFSSVEPLAAFCV
jgi:hypothetical protein